MRCVRAVVTVEKGDGWVVHVTVGEQVDNADSSRASHLGTVPGPSTALSITGIVWKTFILSNGIAEMVSNLGTAAPGDHLVVGKVAVVVRKTNAVFPFRQLENVRFARVVRSRVDDALIVACVEDIRLSLIGDCRR